VAHRELAEQQRPLRYLLQQRALGAAGAKVVFSGRRDSEREKTAKLIRETGAECLHVHSDASKEKDNQSVNAKDGCNLRAARLCLQ
jgi:hypothetical protein